MLNKLLKHDLTATGRLLLPFYALIVLLSTVLRLFDFITEKLFSNEFLYSLLSKLYGFITFMYVLAIIGIFIMTFFLCIQRFYNSVMKNEAYLMLTLPVPRYYNIITKVLNAVIWQTLSIVVVLISLLVIFYEPDFWFEIKDFLNALREMLASTKVPAAFIIIEAILFVLISLISSILMIFAAISIGQMISKRKLLGSVAAYFIINMANQILSVIALTIFYSVTGTFDEESFASSISYTIGLMGMVIVLNAVLCIAYFFIINKILNTKLNLE